MPDNLDRWRVAKQFLDQHGRNAESQAERHRQHCVRTLQAEGTAFWVDVVAAIAQLRSTAPAEARPQ